MFTYPLDTHTTYQRANRSPNGDWPGQHPHQRAARLLPATGICKSTIFYFCFIRIREIVLVSSAFLINIHRGSTRLVNCSIKSRLFIAVISLCDVISELVPVVFYLVSRVQSV